MSDWQFDQRTDHHDWLTVSMIDLLNSVWHSNLSNQSRRHGNTENGYEKTIIFQICMRSNCTPPRKKAILIQKTSFSFLRYHVSPNSWTFNHEINLINQTQPTIPWTSLFKPPPSASYKFINYTNDLNRNLFVWLIHCWLADWSTDWLTDRQIDWLTDGLIAYWPNENFIDRLTHVWLIE